MAKVDGIATRPDTLSVCGDTNNGFGLTFNWNVLEGGSHTLRAFADGVEFGNVTFVVTTLGQEFLRGITGQFTLSDFPQVGDSVIIRWSESHQNFVLGMYESHESIPLPTPFLFTYDFSLTSPEGVASAAPVGMWMFDSNKLPLEFDEISNWLNDPIGILEPINVMWVDFTASNLTEAEENVAKFLRDNGYRTEINGSFLPNAEGQNDPYHCQHRSVGLFYHSENKYAYYGPENPQHPYSYFSPIFRPQYPLKGTWTDRKYPCENNHGRIFPSYNASTEQGFVGYTTGSFSRESRWYTEIIYGHRLLSFNIARDSLEEVGDWEKLGNEGYIYFGNNNVFTDDHDGNVKVFVLYGKLPSPPINPNPSNNSDSIAITTNLSWQNGGGAETYDIYFGTDPSPDSSEFKGRQLDTSFDPGALSYNTTYYWRVDAVNSEGTTTGKVWQFKTRIESIGNGPWVGNWLLVNFLSTEDNGVWDTDDPTGIGMDASITSSTWIERDWQNCTVTFSYSVDSAFKVRKQAINAGGPCIYPPLNIFVETGTLEFHNNGSVMIEYFDSVPEENGIVAFRWIKQN